MAYCTVDDIRSVLSEEILIELTDSAGMGTVDETAVSNAVTRADAIIDGYIGAMVSIPVDPVTDTIKGYSVDIAVYTLFTNKMSAPKHIDKRYEDALNFLVGFADGKGSIGGESSEDSTSDQWPLYKTRDEIFTEDCWKKF